MILRFARFLILFALIVYGIWPYYHLFQLDSALGNDELAQSQLAELVDLEAVQENYKRRLDAGLGGLLPWGVNDDQPLMRSLAEGLDQVGDAAIDRYVSLAWVHETLRQATRDATKQSPPFLISAVNFAFFESYDRFVVRLGELGEGATHIRMRLDGTTWRVTDIIR